MSFSPQSFFINFSVLHLVNYLTSQNELTKSTLLYLLGRKSEGREQFYYYLHQNVCQGWRRRDLGINTKSAEEVLERREQVGERVVASANVFDRLRDLDVREICRRDRRRGHTASRTAMPANIAFAGGNGCRMTIRNKEH
jgi:hypothetical protein